MVLKARLAILFLALCRSAKGETAEVDASAWFVAASPHFEVYSQAGPESARRTLLRFEEIRAFFDRNRIFAWASRNPDVAQPIRVVEFRTAEQYSAVRIHPLADAFFAAVDETNYIAMPVLSANRLGIAAHEYAHYALHAGGKHLPLWLNEGLAEVFSTIAFTARGCEMGGEITERARVLRQQTWMPAPEFFRTAKVDTTDPQRTSLFYSQSWALTEMLISAPDMASRFAEVVDQLNSGAEIGQVLKSVYGKSAEQILAEARQWIRQGRFQRRRFPPLPTDAAVVTVRPAGELQVKTVIAELVATNGDLDRARHLYKELLAASPGNPALLAAMGTLALRQGDSHQAIEYWRAAVKAGVKNAALCFRYARLLDQMNGPTDEIKQALERVIFLRPDSDEAHYRLALIASNQGDYPAAIVQLQAMRDLAPGVAFSYWSILSSALNEVGRRDEAIQAATKAQQAAANGEQSARAAQLAHFARTEIQVQYVRDSEGNTHLATVRAPRGSAVNPFVEAQDEILSASGALREVECTDGSLTAVFVQAPAGLLKLSVVDPARVLIKNGKSEFTCGPQKQAITVTVDYAAGNEVLFGVSTRNGGGWPHYI